MNIKIPDRKQIILFITSFVVIITGAYLYKYSLNEKPFSDELLIWDAIWLDFWTLLFITSFLIIWNYTSSWKSRGSILVGLFSINGFIAVCLFFDGTLFGLNAFWGDQKFRITMILKFMNWFVPGDYYYEDLTVFYPPVHYYLLSLYARIFSLEAFQMIKVGTQLIYLIGPFILYSLWRKLVSGYQALLIVIASIIICSIGKVIPMSGHHAFVSNTLFIPWWLYYIERSKYAFENKKEYIFGAIIGSLIFATYFYPFFLGAFLLGLRILFYSKFKNWGFNKSFRWKSVITVLSLTALICAPYWLPVLIEMIRFGNHGSGECWYHIGSSGISFSFQDFSIIGILYFISIIYFISRKYSTVNRGLLLLLGTTVTFYLYATFMGAIGKPANIVKANEFVIVLGGAFVGLFTASMLRKYRKIKKYKLSVYFIFIIIFGVLLNNFNNAVKHPMVKTARTAIIPNWNFNEDDLLEYKGKVFLTDYEELAVFYPVYYFIAHNQHYSHPASRHIQRFCFLKALQVVDDPYLFNLALRYNVFDEVEYLMPRIKGDQFLITLSLSNYPNKYSSHTLSYKTLLLSDTSFFEKKQGDNLYKVINKDMTVLDSNLFIDRVLALESLMHYKLLRNYLNDIGQKLLDKRLGIAWENWKPLLGDEDNLSIADKIKFLDARSVEDGDTLHLLFAFYSDHNFNVDYRVFLHAYPSHGEYSFDNYDFVTYPNTTTWRRGDIIIYKKSIPYYSDYEKFHLGFFNKDGRLDEGLWMFLK